MSVALGSCINDKQTTRSDDLVMAVIVKSLTVLRKDRSERHSPALREGHALHPADDVLLQRAWLAASARLSMHPVAEFACLVDFLYLALLLDQTHRHN